MLLDEVLLPLAEPADRPLEPKERPELLKRAETQIGRLGFQWPPAIIRGAATLGERKSELSDELGEP